MNIDFTHVMSERTDKQLADIVTIKRDEYQPEALLAAEKELEKRNLSAKEFYSDEEVEKIKGFTVTQIAELKLPWHYKILTVALPILIFTVYILLTRRLAISYFFRLAPLPLVLLAQYMIHRDIKARGYIRMAVDFKKWVVYTFYIYIAIVLMLAGLFYVLMMLDYKW